MAKKTKQHRLKSLVLTETEDKAKVLRKFLSRQYQVISTDGFLRDLPKTKLGLDVENNFAEKYMTIRGKGKLLEQIRKESINARRIYLATNPDCEGEMNAYHFCNLFGINPVSHCKMILNELTKESIRNSIESAQSLNMKAVEMYETQQAVERLFIHELNPLFWHKIYRGISISRSQAFVLKLICEQEKKLQVIPHEPALDEQLKNEPLTLKTLLYAASKYLNLKIGMITITLRQLYEGVTLDKTVSGLITYYKDSEIKPSSEMLTPESVKSFVTRNQYKIYNLIWQYCQNELQLSTENDEEHVRYNDYILMEQLEAQKIDWSETFSIAVCGLLKRGYIKLAEDNGYKPTELGLEVLGILKQNFTTIINVKNILKLEEQIHEVESGSLTKLQVVEPFYKQLNSCMKKVIDKIGTELTPKEPPIIETDEVCEKCGRKMIIRHSRYGLFLACQGYPECKNTKPYVEYIDEKCPKCGGKLTKRQWNRSKEFYSCEHFPDCDFSTWDTPQKKPCTVFAQM